ncbi:MAG TPA: hypothetical protein VGL57_13305 [Solirubrobacteraceae bacterium]
MNDRPRTGPMLFLIAVGLLMSVVMLAVLIPKLGHLAHPPPGSASAVHAAAHRTHKGHGWLTFTHFVWVVGASGVVSAVAVGWWLVAVVRRRLENRLTREYGVFEVRLSMHDQAREQEVTDMVEALLGAVREFPEQRSSQGQPFVCFEAHYGPGEGGELEWVLCLRCERQLAAALDGIISAAYPDVRVGYRFAGPPREIGGRIPRPGHVLRLRKQRSFVFPLTDEVQPGAARPLEAVAQAQAAAGVPSSVRIQMTPCALPVERFARTRLRDREARLAADDGGHLGSLSSSEMQAAARSQSHTWCWLEVQVAAPNREIANRIAAVVQARRGQNRLQRRWMIWREDLYRDRFPSAYPPLLPGLGLRTLASASEVAQLVALPTGRLKNVPVRRLALPRLPAPPDLQIAEPDAQPGRPPTREE